MTWEQLSEKERIYFANNEYHDYKENDVVNIKGKGKVGYVSKKINDLDTGEQAYIITSENPKAPNYDPKKVKNVTILYRGSSGLNHIAEKNSLGHDARKDWTQNDIPAAFNILNNVQPASTLRKFSQATSGGFPLSSYNTAIKMLNRPTPQMRASAHTLSRAMKVYCNAQFDIYGHSLGSMNGQYALAATTEKQAKRVRAAYLYEGPNTYALLNKQEKKRADQLKERVFNYIDPKDKITLASLDYRQTQKSVGTVIRVDSMKVTGGSLLDNLTSQHMWGGYQFDSDGGLKVVHQIKGKKASSVGESQASGFVVAEKIALQKDSVDAAIASLKASEEPLKNIKKINNQIYPDMQKRFQQIIDDACDLPYITPKDVAEVVERHHLEPKYHVDLDKIEASNQLVDQNLARIDNLIKGLKQAAEHIEQDDKDWAVKFTAE
ncbi:hypothetical protein LFYK43_16250 [Ligilactobacillus salitolerans]|uniref:Fungal lipase-like domain-containing protein n=1 Tax=Ligilactobacillus salitolerans TaxID=1808352 RepID=A0A401IUH4_9LACO|nr:hypothetical protein [Ligilactobacillus salitolerans]GBG95166.1 hypothetical protein LFYK43_16250 [Ligilactobacillus salitolerans]